MALSPPSSRPAPAFTSAYQRARGSHQPARDRLTIAVPVSVFLALICAIYYCLVQRFESFHIALLSATAPVIVRRVAAAASGVRKAACLVILMFAPVVTVVGYEMRRYRHQTVTET